MIRMFVCIQVYPRYNLLHIKCTVVYSVVGHLLFHIALLYYQFQSEFCYPEYWYTCRKVKY